MPTDWTALGQPILIASHPRSGTHLTIDLLRRQFRECASWKYPGESLGRLYLALEGMALAPNANGISVQAAWETLQRPIRPLLKTHAGPSITYLNHKHPDLYAWISNNATRIYVLRDGRAVLCSLHLFMQSYDPSTRCSLSDFLRQQEEGQSRVKRWVNHINHWLEQPHIQVLKFEDLIDNPRETLTLLGHALDLKPQYKEPLLPRSPNNIWQGRWARLTQVRPESTAIIGFYRGQKTQKWQDSFTESDRKFFHEEAGDVLMKLGYVNSDAWVTSN